jgi:hypothetical protein
MRDIRVTVSVKKAIVDIFVNSIFLYDDKFVIAFNWEDGTKTLSLTELETATDGDNSVGESAESRNVLNLKDFKSSHLDDNAPPHNIPFLYTSILCRYRAFEPSCSISSVSI